MICGGCLQEHNRAIYCRRSHSVEIEGMRYFNVAFTSEGPQCPDCGVLSGSLHHVGCPKEVCPRCGSYLVKCQCVPVKKVQLLLERGGITIQEVKELRCNSAEWEALYLKMDDEAFLASLSNVLNNCSLSKIPATTYDQVLSAVFVPELIRRFTELKGKVNVGTGGR